MRSSAIIVAVSLVSVQVSAQSSRPRFRGELEVKGVRELRRTAAGTRFEVSYVSYSDVHRVRRREVTVGPGAELLVAKSRAGAQGRSWSIAVDNKGAGKLRSTYYRGNEMQYAPLSIQLSASYAAGGKTRIQANVSNGYDGGFLVPRASRKRQISRWKDMVVRDDCAGTTCWSGIQQRGGTRVAEKMQIARVVQTSSRPQAVSLGTFDLYNGASSMMASVEHSGGRLTSLLTETPIRHK